MANNHVTFQIESWSDILPEMEPLWAAHWHEAESDHAIMPLNLDKQEYEQLEASGMLLITTVRDNGTLIGYHTAVLRDHPHSKGFLTAFTTTFFISPSERKGWAGIKLFKFLTDELQRRGVKKVYAATKDHLDIGPIFMRLGWKKEETVYSKYLGE